MSLSVATAGNLAGWHNACTRSIGVASATSAWEWATLERVPMIFFAAITLGPAPEAAEIPTRRDRLIEPLAGRTEWLAVCDSWSALDLGGSGFQPEDPQVWMSRPADSGPPEQPRPSAAGVEILKVTDERGLVGFEAAHNEGFGAKPTPPGTYYGTPILDDPRMTVIVARAADGRPVGTAMAYVSDPVVGIYSVSVIPTFRGRGIGWSLTRAALATAPDRIAVLQPSEEGLSMYRRMGFEPFASFATWVRPEANRNA